MRAQICGAIRILRLLCMISKELKKPKWTLTKLGSFFAVFYRCISVSEKMLLCYRCLKLRKHNVSPKRFQDEVALLVFVLFGIFVDRCAVGARGVALIADFVRVEEVLVA